jgi:hypothetical protein
MPKARLSAAAEKITDRQLRRHIGEGLVRGCSLGGIDGNNTRSSELLRVRLPNAKQAAAATAVMVVLAIFLKSIIAPSCYAEITKGEFHLSAK